MGELEPQPEIAPVLVSAPLPQGIQGVRPVGMIAGPKVGGKGPGKFQMPTEIPGVKELCEKHTIDQLLQVQLNTELRKRPMSFESDLEALEEALNAARVPAATLMIKIKELQQGAFVGMIPNQKQITEMAKKFILDEQAVQKLTEVMTKIGKERGKTALDHLETHLERSNKPSALVMMNLAKIRSGEEIGEANRGAAPGSYLWEQREKEKKEQEDKRKQEKEERDANRCRDRSRGRCKSRERGQDRHISHGRGGDRSRDWERDRDRDRGYDRGGRDREADRDHDSHYDRPRADDLGRGRDRGHDRAHDRGRGDDRAYDRGRNHREQDWHQSCSPEPIVRSRHHEREVHQNCGYGYGENKSFDRDHRRSR